jgi:2-dehydropantoate 2-reductase
LAQAGADLTVAARGEHARAIRERGLVIEAGTPGGGARGNTEARGQNGHEETVRLPRVARAEELEPSFDVIFLAVKWPALEAACAELQRLLSPHGVVVPLLNGLESEDVVARFVGAQRTLAAVAYMSSGLVSPGRIYAHGNTRAGLAPYRPGQEAELERVARALEGAGIPVRRHADHRTMLWEKMVWNAPFNAICALTGKCAGDALALCEGLLRSAMAEVITVARADGATLGAPLIDVMLASTRAEYPWTEPSMLQDVRAGRATEVDILQGAVAERAAQHGLDAPIMSTLASLVRGLSAPGSRAAVQPSLGG